MAAYTTQTITPRYHHALLGWQVKNFPELDFLERNWTKFFASQTPFQLFAKIGKLGSDNIDQGKFAGRPRFERALLALQGPSAAAVLGRLAPGVERMSFMSAAEIAVGGIPASITRSGYTGEDGFELSFDATEAERVADLLCAEPEVKPIQARSSGPTSTPGPSTE